MSVHFPKDDDIAITNVIPESHWDETSQLFFAPLKEQELILAASPQVTFGTSTVKVVVYIDFHNNINKPLCKIFDEDLYIHHASWLFRYVRGGHDYDVTSKDVEADRLEILRFPNQVVFCIHEVTTIIPCL
jgi:hypothetical protein